MKGFVIPEQPRDPNDFLYKLIDMVKADNDVVEIAKKKGVTEQAVSQVRKGRTISKKIWNEIMTITLRRAEAREAARKYMNS